MIYGTGVDILSQQRIEKVYSRHGNRFARKILCAAELKEFRQSKKPARFLAMAFAAKEAFVKALGTGFRGVGYRDAGTVHEASGKPVLIYSRKMRGLLKQRAIAGGHVSLSDEAGMVCAMVILERA